MKEKPNTESLACIHVTLLRQRREPQLSMSSQVLHRLGARDCEWTAIRKAV